MDFDSVKLSGQDLYRDMKDIETALSLIVIKIDVNITCKHDLVAIVFFLFCFVFGFFL